MAKENNWATYSMREAPYWRNGMTPEEYDREREYFYKHIDDVKKGNYLPLWKQNNK